MNTTWQNTTCVCPSPTDECANIVTTLNSTFNSTFNLNMSGMNVNNADQSQDMYRIINVIAATICVITIFIGIAGNLLVLIVFGSRWSRLRSFEVYMVSLALADFIVTITYPSFMLHSHIGGSFCALGSRGCAVVLFLASTGVTVSSITLIFISLDRYIVVKWPLRQRQHKYKIYAVVLVTWIVGTSVGTLYLPKNRIYLLHDGNRAVCGLNFTSEKQHKKFVALLFIVQSGIPLLLVTILYVLIIRELKKVSILTVLLNNENLIRQRHERNKKAIKILVAIIIVFIVSITPEKVFYLIYTYNPRFIDYALFVPVHSIFTMIFMTNNCINPIIYAKLHTSFRKRTLKLFCSCLCPKYKSYTWTSLRCSLQTMVSYSVRRASSAFSRNSETSTLSNGNRLRSRSMNGSLSNDLSVRPDSMQRTLSGPPNVFVNDITKVFVEEIQDHENNSMYTESDLLRPPRLSVLVEDDTDHIRAGHMKYPSSI